VPSSLESFVAFNAQKVCPKCELAWFPRLNSQWHPDAAQSVERDCPEAEHLHVQCMNCSFPSFFAPADALTSTVDAQNGWLS
jgi:predicted nucleic-acid-binding Zn-ribbon protein